MRLEDDTLGIPADALDSFHVPTPERRSERSETALWHPAHVTLVAVPADDAPLLEVMQFASTSYYGYDRHGGVEGLATLANRALDTWCASRQLPESESAVRASLFFESRRWHHFGDASDDDAEEYIRALVSQLRSLSGGSVKADRDRLSWRIRRSSRLLNWEIRRRLRLSD